MGTETIFIVIHILFRALRRGQQPRWPFFVHGCTYPKRPGMAYAQGLCMDALIQSGQGWHTRRACAWMQLSKAARDDVNSDAMWLHKIIASASLSACSLAYATCLKKVCKKVLLTF